MRLEDRATGCIARIVPDAARAANRDDRRSAVTSRAILRASVRCTPLARVAIGVTLQAHVALLAPEAAPRVANDLIVLVACSIVSIANNLDDVIDIDITELTAREYTR